MKKKKLLREYYRNCTFKRDKYKCVMCDAGNVELDAHHITDRSEMPNQGYTLYNLISLCNSCHIKAEMYHNSNKISYVKGYHPDDLYKKINSSYDLAYNMSLKIE